MVVDLLTGDVVYPRCARCWNHQWREGYPKYDAQGRMTESGPIYTPFHDGCWNCSHSDECAEYEECNV
jgi:hypothetical protein